MYTWVPLYQDISKKLLEYEDRQSELIAILKQVGIDGFNDQDISGPIELSEIDPFTFYFYINKHGEAKRLSLINGIAKKFDLNIQATDVNGIPSAFPQNVWMFPYKKDRDSKYIPFLWNLFRQAVQGNINATDFDKLLNTKGSGQAKVSSAMFYANPIEYFPVNQQTIEKIERNGIEPKFNNLASYLNIINKIKAKDNKPTYQISYESWLENTSAAPGVNEPPNLGFEVMPKQRKEGELNYWKIAPDEKAKRWPEFFNKGIMAVSFKGNNSGDLRQYSTLQDLEEAIGKKNSNEALSLWTCCHASIGDIVFANKGRDIVVGVGIIDGPYEYLADDDFPHRRTVKWIADKEWTYTSGQFGDDIRKRPNLFRPDTLSRTEVGPEILEAYIEKYPEFENVFEENGIWPIYEDASYENLVKRISKFKDHLLLIKCFDFVRDIFQKLNIEGDDKSLFCTASKGKVIISITYGQRIIFSVRNNSDGLYVSAMVKPADLLKYKNYPAIQSGNFTGPKPEVSWIYFKCSSDKDLSKQLFEDVCKAVGEQKSVGVKFSYQKIHREANNIHIYKMIMDNSIREKIFREAHKPAPNGGELIAANPQRTFHPLNTILYGPPGTGKTYNSINKAIEIIEPSFDFNQDRSVIKREYDRLVLNGQIVFTTFHQSMSYEDFIEGIKPIEPEKEGDPVIYKIQLGILRNLCIEASFAIAQLREGRVTEEVLDFSILYDNLADNVEERILKGEKVEFVTKGGGSIMVEGISQQGNFIIKHHEGTRTYTVSKQRLAKLQSAIKDLNDVSNIDHQFRTIIGGSNSSAYWSVLNAIRNTKPSSTINKQFRTYTFDEKQEVVQSLLLEDYSNKSAKPFVLIIDEINRGNVSQIFGELITLIEEDKRLGKEEALEAILPYSKEKFGVPPNLYIIGTMNTADRSVEALDAALRRRFSFEEMPPKPELIASSGRLKAERGILNGIDLSLVLSIINRRIEKLLDKDHQIGHSYFMSVSNFDELKSVFQNKIIPLMQEYFFGDYGKIGLVLGKGFFEEIENTNEKLFAEFDDYDASEFSERPVYKIKNLLGMQEEEFNTAINILLK